MNSPQLFSPALRSPKASRRAPGCKSMAPSLIYHQHNLTNLSSGITTHIAVVLFASSLGRWIDGAPSRLRTLVATFSINRLAVILACLCWAIILPAPRRKDDEQAELDYRSKPTNITPSNPLGGLELAVFLMILALGIIERLSRLANLVSIERDWVPALATPSQNESDGNDSAVDLTHLNAVMARIDLVCKLGAPVATSAFMGSSNSPRIAALILIALNAACLPLEYWTAKSVWKWSEQLQEPKTSETALSPDALEPSGFLHVYSESHSSLARTGIHILSTAFLWMSDWLRHYVESLRQYFGTTVWIPSLATTGLHFSVLSFSSTFVVFLMDSGFTANIITIAEIAGAVLELSSTIVFPWGVRVLSARHATYAPLSDDLDEQGETIQVYTELTKDSQPTQGLSLQDPQNAGVSQLGLWAFGFLLLSLVKAPPPFPYLKILPLLTHVPRSQLSPFSTRSLAPGPLHQLPPPRLPNHPSGTNIQQQSSSSSSSSPFPASAAGQQPSAPSS